MISKYDAIDASLKKFSKDKYTAGDDGVGNDIYIRGCCFIF